MKLTIKESQQWKNWKLAQIDAEIQIYEGLLRMARNERAWFNGLHGANLETRFGCESEEDLQPFREDQAGWKRELEDLWIAGELARRATA